MPELNTALPKTELHRVLFPTPGLPKNTTTSLGLANGVVAVPSFSESDPFVVGLLQLQLFISNKLHSNSELSALLVTLIMFIYSKSIVIHNFDL